MYKIGLGYDIHRLTKGRKLILGGVEISHIYGLDGHSDADVLIHAIIDSLLGALGEADIGTFFPDTDPKYKNISSLLLLEKITCIISDKNSKISNIDSVIIAEKPKLFSYIPEMRKKLSSVLQINISDITIKATTNETIGTVGREEGIASQAVSLIQRIRN